MEPGRYHAISECRLIQNMLNTVKNDRKEIFRQPMKRIIQLIITLQFASAAVNAQPPLPDGKSVNTEFPSGCTVITVAKGDSVFFGGNDDYVNPDSWYWVDPGDSSRYGVIWIGKPDNPQQGVNEKGLAYDANGLPRADVNPHPERLPVPGGYHNLCMQIMHECATVEEVIHWVNTHRRFPYMHDQMHFADKTGDAVIISAGKDGEMVFTRKKPGDGFLVSTNFNVANTAVNTGFPCWRYDKANEMLSRLMERHELVTFQDLVKIMDAVHQEKPTWTIETMVADLVNGKVYLYYFFQYDKPVVLNVREELLHPREGGPLSELFPEEVKQEADRRYQEIQAGARFLKTIAFVWLALVALSMMLYFALCHHIAKGFKLWLPVMIVLGPFAFILRCLVVGKQNMTNWHKALIETLPDLVPLVISITLAIAILISTMFSGNATPLLQVALVFGLPLIAGLLFHLVYLYPHSSMSSGKFLARRLAQVMVTTFLGLGGIIPVAMPLINKNLVVSMIAPLSPAAVLSWWAFIATGAVAGAVFVFLYEWWAVRKGYQAWNVVATEEVEAVTPSWKKIWWWLPVSLIVMILGLVAGIILSK